MYVQGYDAKTKKVKCLNSWGEKNNPEPEVPMDDPSNIFYQFKCETELITSPEQLQAAQSSGSKTYDDIAKENVKKRGHLDQEVSEMLDKLSLGELKPIFAEQELKIEELRDYDMEAFRTMGLKRVRDIKLIIEEVRLKKKQSLDFNLSSFSKVEKRSPHITISTHDASKYDMNAALCLGLYKAAGTHDGVTYYEHLDTVNSGFGYIYCYRQAGKWWTGYKLGATEDDRLCCDVGGDFPPASGWKYYTFGSYYADPKLSVHYGLMTPCQSVTISVSDNTELDHFIAGEYHLVPDQYHCGHVIMQHSFKESLLMFNGNWQVMDKRFDTIASNMDGRRTVCPGKNHNTEWRYNGKDVTITIKCHTH